MTTTLQPVIVRRGDPSGENQRSSSSELARRPTVVTPARQQGSATLMNLRDLGAAPREKFRFGPSSGSPGGAYAVAAGEPGVPALRVPDSPAALLLATRGLNQSEAALLHELNTERDDRSRETHRNMEDTAERILQQEKKAMDLQLHAAELETLRENTRLLAQIITEGGRALVDITR